MLDLDKIQGNFDQKLNSFESSDFKNWLFKKRYNIILDGELLDCEEMESHDVNYSVSKLLNVGHDQDITISLEVNLSYKMAS